LTLCWARLARGRGRRGGYDHTKTAEMRSKKPKERSGYYFLQRGLSNSLPPFFLAFPLFSQRQANGHISCAFRHIPPRSWCDLHFALSHPTHRGRPPPSSQRHRIARVYTTRCAQATCTHDWPRSFTMPSDRKGTDAFSDWALVNLSSSRDSIFFARAAEEWCRWLRQPLLAASVLVLTLAYPCLLSRVRCGAAGRRAHGYVAGAPNADARGPSRQRPRRAALLSAIFFAYPCSCAAQTPAGDGCNINS